MLRPPTGPRARGQWGLAAAVAALPSWRHQRPLAGLLGASSGVRRDVAEPQPAGCCATYPGHCARHRLLGAAGRTRLPHVPPAVRGGRACCICFFKLTLIIVWTWAAFFTLIFSGDAYWNGLVF